MHLDPGMTMKAHWSVYSAFCLVVFICGGAYGADLGPSARGAEDRAPVSLVGDTGDSRNIAFEGNQTFTSAQLQNGLKANLDFQLAAHPLAPREEYLQTLQKMVRAGYLHAGFPAVKVAARRDAATGKVRVNIFEGPQYNCGAIRVIGAKTLAVEPFIRQLAESFSESTNSVQSATGKADENPRVTKEVGLAQLTNQPVRLAIWIPGKPASFEPAALNSLTDSVTNTLAGLGYFFAKAKVQVLTEPGNQAATLQVEIIEEGSRGVIDSIEITGATKNSREEILKYVGLAPGMPLDRELIRKVEQSLWQSGRFLSGTLTPQQTDKVGKLMLRMELREYDGAPPLTQEFTRDEKVFLKLRDWLADWPNRGEDLHLTVKQEPASSKATYEFQWVFSRSGIAMALYESDPQTPTHMSLRYGLIGAPNAFGVYSTARQRKLEVSQLKGQIVTSVSILPNPDTNALDRFVSQLAAGISTTDSDPRFKAEVTLTPAAFVSLSQNKTYKLIYDKDRLTIQGENGSLLCNPDTGRPEEFNFRLPAKGANEGGLSLGKLEGRVTIEAGAFARLNREITDSFATQPNLYHSKAPWSSVIAFVLDELVRTPLVTQFIFREMPPEKMKLATASLEKLSRKQFQILAPLDRLKAGLVNDEKPFFIPNEPGDQPNVNNSVAALSGGLLLGLSNDLLPRDSWAASLAREAALVFVGKGKYAGQVLGSIHQSPDSGPLAFLVAAKVLSYVNPQASQAFATMGLNRLLAEDFRRDCRVFLEGDSIFTECLVNLVAALRDMDDPEIEALASVLRPTESELLRPAVSVLRQHKDQPLYQALSPTLDEYWNQTLKQRVRVALLKLALGQRPGSTSAGPAKAVAPVSEANPSSTPDNPTDPEAQFQLGRRLARGQPTPADAAEAVRWYRKAAEQGHANAQADLAYAYAEGKGVGVDQAEAAKWFRKAAEQGQSVAQFNLGVVYMQGTGVAQDYAEAVKWFRLRAEKDDADAQSLLGVMYAQRLGVPQDYAVAEKWLRRSAEQGNAQGQLNLGAFYHERTDGLQDDVEALVWISLAAAQGNELANKHKAQLMGKLSPAQIGEVESRVKVFTPKKPVPKTQANPAN
jgi:TPR repeat protein